MDPYQQQFVSDMQAMFDNILLWEKTCFNNSLEKWKSLNWDIYLFIYWFQYHRDKLL